MSNCHTGILIRGGGGMEDRNVHCFDQTLILGQATRPLSGKLASAQLTAVFDWALTAGIEKPSWNLFNRIGDCLVPVGETQLGVLTVSLCTDVSISNKISNRPGLTHSTHIKALI